MPAGRFKLDEVSIPQGFLELEEDLIFEVNNRNKTLEYDSDWDAWITVDVKNRQPKGELIINKTVALREDVDISLVDVSDLSKIQFKLVAKEDVIDMADGSVIYSKGQEVGTYNLTKEGNLTVKDIHMGCYELYECRTLEGLVLDNTRYEIKFTQEDTVKKVYTETRDVINDTTFVEISKKAVTGEEELLGATLTVLDENDEKIDTWVSDKTAHKIEGLQVGKIYTLREEIAVKGYVKATDVKFKIENTNDIQRVTMIDKIVEVSKEDIGGEEIKGAKLQVLDKETKEVVDEWVSGDTSHRVNNLEENKVYILHEEVCVDGFVKASDQEFTVSEDKKTQRVVMIDKIVLVSKTDLTTGDELEGAELVITDENNEIVDQWISTKTPHRVSNLEEGKIYLLTERLAPYRI